ncbi:hypothetical protein SAMN05216228_103447 [Rhizobium tibeticum]|uniref:Uncharacterized protein n=1 Tax=Rhizobium tibeticum TaxID=501024 RepID=A0A1H8UI98_9HYPH|nr:hypothetical protein RTCCBAU85039_5596 [Rhizobium tibeticum]SEP02949.1 hypothetical protein SAMN05216228_103447 [Rhizobium tibeticum]
MVSRNQLEWVLSFELGGRFRQLKKSFAACQGLKASHIPIRVKRLLAITTQPAVRATEKAGMALTSSTKRPVSKAKNSY